MPFKVKSLRSVTSLNAAAMRKAMKALATMNPLTMGVTPTAWTTATGTINGRISTEERVSEWMKGIWMEFCKAVIEMDSRFSLYPKSDMRSILYGDSSRDGVLSDFVLRREGAYTDVYVDRIDGKIGFVIIAGNKLQYVKIMARPSKGMAMPVIAMTDELEDQFNQDVEKARKSIKFQDARRNKKNEMLANMYGKGAGKYKVK